MARTPGPSSQSSSRRNLEATTGPRPEVVVDFHVERGVLFVVLKNIGAASAFSVSTRFECGFRGLGGTRDIAAMALFQGVEFMPPGKEFRQIVDSASAYFARHEPSRIVAVITYSDRAGRHFIDTIAHNLEIYRELSDTAGF